MAGWWLHGGGGEGALADDGDRFLRLNAGQTRRHGRFFLPDHTSAVRFCRTVESAGPSDELTVTFNKGAESRILYHEDPIAASGWQCFTVSLQDNESGAVGTIEFALHDNGVAPDARIGIDDIRLVVGLFSDGFESGDLSGWTVVLP